MPADIPAHPESDRYLLRQVDELADELDRTRQELELAKRISPLALELASEVMPTLYHQAADSIENLATAERTRLRDGTGPSLEFINGMEHAAGALRRAADDQERDRHGI